MSADGYLPPGVEHADVEAAAPGNRGAQLASVTAPCGCLVLDDEWCRACGGCGGRDVEWAGCCRCVEADHG